MGILIFEYVQAQTFFEGIKMNASSASKFDFALPGSRFESWLELNLNLTLTLHRKLMGLTECQYCNPKASCSALKAFRVRSLAESNIFVSTLTLRVKTET